MKTTANIYGTPVISFNDGKIRISGKSILVDASLIYSQLLDEFHSYMQHPCEKTEVHINLDFANSSSNRHLLNFLILAERLEYQGKKVEVFWYYHKDDELMLDQGSVFKDLLDLPFQLVELD
jgi:hypothetical protein